MEKNSLDILQNIFFCILWNEEIHMELKVSQFSFFVALVI